MKYLSAEQTPIVEDGIVRAWVVRVRAEQDGVEAVLEETVTLLDSEQVKLTDWTLAAMQNLINRVSEERNMLFRAAQLVIDKQQKP
jgi:hypothetical protein